MDSDDPVELKAVISGLQRELELSNFRSRRLIATMTAKLQAKEAELFNFRLLRDRQLKQILTQLLTFQSELSKDNNAINSKLTEKDKLVQELQQEVCKLKEENKRLCAEKNKVAPSSCVQNGKEDDDDDDAPSIAFSIQSVQAKEKPDKRLKPSLPPKPKLKPKPLEKPKPIDKKVLKSGLKSVNGVSKEVKRTVRFNLDCDYRYDSDASDMTECDTSRPVSILDTINRLLEKDSSPSKQEQNSPKEEHISLKLQPLESTPPISPTKPPAKVLTNHVKTPQTDLSLKHNIINDRQSSCVHQNHKNDSKSGEKLQSILKLSKSDSDIVKPTIRTSLKKQISDSQVHNNHAQTSDSDLGSSSESLSSIESPSKDKNNSKTRHDILKDVSDHMVRQNFEEFKLEIVEEDEQNKRTNKKEVPRKEGDGAESGTEQSIFESDYRKMFYFNGSYEKFLEATGLSQKSLLSPSRLMTNHRSVLKPKDVKNRSRIKAALSLPGPEDSNGVIKYWTEPFL